MKPVPYLFPWITTDLTCGYPHRIVTGDAVRYVILFPKTWEPAGDRFEGPNGAMIQRYRVLTWDEVTLTLD